MTMGGECFEEAIMFIEKDGDKNKAVRIVAELARLTPDRLYNRWPPSDP